MHFSLLLGLVTITANHAYALERRLPAGIALTDNVLELEVAEAPKGFMTPSSRYLASLRHNAMRKQAKRQNDAVAIVQENLMTPGGRVYMASITISNRVYSLVLDTGSSDTWVAASGFVCRNEAGAVVLTATCGFGPLYNTAVARVYRPYVPPQTFGVNYTSGEYLKGTLATDLFGLGDVGDGYAPRQIVNQTIGVVREGYWQGDGISTGLMGLAYTRLASGSSSVDYEAVMFSLFDQGYYPPVFSLALSRTLVNGPARAPGGTIAVGGIPADTTYDSTSWSDSAIVPLSAGVYTYYSVAIDGFSITAPAGTTPPAPPKNFATARQNIIVDSGTTLIYLHDDTANYIASLFSPPAFFNAASQLWLVDCKASAPRFGVNIQGKTYVMNTDDLMNRGNGSVGGLSAGAKAGQCVLATQRAAGGASVLGDAWLKNVLVVFDLGGNRVRVAARGAY